MALTLADRPLYQWSVSDVHRMLESGVLTEDTPVELLEGVLVDVSPKSPEHGWTIVQIGRWLGLLPDGDDYTVRFEQPIVSADGLSMPEPDVSVVAGEIDRHAHPRTAALVIEVSISSLRVDREVKSRLYASAGVPDYWIVDVEHRSLEVRREPEGEAYRSVEVFGPDDSVTPVELELPPLALRTIF